jgi:tetratricopeptide (TPR) repeat protein
VPPLAEALKGEAKADYDAGRILYGDGDFAAAAVKFQRAFDLSKEPRLLWNIAVCQKQLRRYALVSRLVRQYLETAGPTLTEADKAEATNLQAALKAFISSVTFNVSEPGATVEVDEEVVGTSPIAGSVFVGIGTPRVRITKPGFKEYTTTLKVAGSDGLVVDAKLVREPRDLYRLTVGDIAGIERRGEKSATKCLAELTSKLPLSLPTFLTALGIDRTRPHSAGRAVVGAVLLAIAQAGISAINYWMAAFAGPST